LPIREARTQHVTALTEVLAAMPIPDLPTCPLLGPVPGGQPQFNRELPSDYATHPLKYLPPKIVLSDSDLDLAARYERGDFSGGYLKSQIARFRRGPSTEQHQKRREKLRRLKTEVDRRGLVLPQAFVELVESDEYVSRLRHNSIWIHLPDELVPLPSDPRLTLFLIFGEGQGCGFWHLLLAPDGGHAVTYSEHPFGLRDLYPSGYQPDLGAFKVYRCADTFAQWIVNFFAESIDGDRQYEEILRKYSSM
jgi:hypothetical protein